MDRGDDESSRARLFKLLNERAGQTVPGSYLTEKLECSRQAVFKLVAALRGEGIGITSEQQKGYRLESYENSDALSPTLLDFLLDGNPLFHKCLCFEELPSTQIIIKKLAAQDAPQGVVAAADSQTEGRGRRGRGWQAPAGRNLSFSMLLRPNLRPGEVQMLNLAAGIAVRRTIERYYNLKTELKWPNDVLCGGRKLCGILSEAAGEPDRIYYAVTGVGLNVNLRAEDISADICDIATSLLIETGAPVPRTMLLARLLDEFAALVLDLDSPGGAARLMASYKSECDTIGKRVLVLQDGAEFRGTAEGVTEQGALIVNINENMKTFAAADVQHLRRA